MKIVVLGAGGLLGRAVLDELQGRQVVAMPHAVCDITRKDEVHERTAGAALIINCAAFTNVDGAEKDEAGAYRANTLGAQNVARAAASHRARLVHISTDFVFDGAQDEPYDEFASPNPQSIYARSKWAGEELARAAHRELFVVRVQGLYGAGGGNFASKLRQLVLAGKPLTLDGERRVQPTWVRVAARQIVRLTQGDDYGTYHVSCRDETTWAGFAARLAEKLGVAAGWKVVRSADLAASAKRPPNCVFRHRRLEMLGDDTLMTWQAAQDAYLQEEAAR